MYTYKEILYSSVHYNFTALTRIPLLSLPNLVSTLTIALLRNGAPPVPLQPNQFSIPRYINATNVNTRKIESSLLSEGYICHNVRLILL